jgi:hypothetical protein
LAARYTPSCFLRGWYEWLAQTWRRKKMKKVTERSIRLTIGMMRSIASHKPISPFHLAAADDMEAMLKELLELRKKLKEKDK